MKDENRRVTMGMLKAVPEKWNVEGNWAVFEEQLRRHKDDGIDVFITPEGFLDGYCTADNDGWTIEKFAKVAQDVTNSDYIKRLRELAAETKTNIVFGFTELLNDLFYNCAILVDLNGGIVGKYHKTHLMNHDHRYTRGEGLPVFDLNIGRVGIVICADRRWPESIRVLRLKGAKICLMPTYGMWHLDNEWWMRTRSYENSMYVCFTHPNVSLITNPKGEIDAKLQSSVPDVLVHEIDISNANDKGDLANRRPDLYGVIADESHPMKQGPYEPPSLKNVEDADSKG